MLNSAVDRLGVAQTFAQFLHATSEAYSDAIAFKLCREGHEDDAVSFREIETWSARIAKGLIARGIGKGARVGFILGNGPDFAIVLAAIARVGAIAVPISTLIKANELVRVLCQSDNGGLIVQRSLFGHDYVERFCAALPELAQGDGPHLRLAATPYLRWIISSGGDLPKTFRHMRHLTDAADEISDNPKTIAVI